VRGAKGHPTGRGCHKTISVLLLLLFCGRAVWAAEKADAAKALVLPENLLGTAYVDIRHGFSVRGPFGSQLTGGGGKREFKGWDLPDISCWELLRFPESKSLVGFAEKEKQRFLQISLLATRRKLKIAQMLEARRSFWQQYPDRAEINEAHTETINGFPAALLAVSWKGKEKDKGMGTIREALIQTKRNRYFSLTLFAGSKTEQAKNASLMDLLVSNFVCFDKKEGDQRWLGARKQAQKLLAKLKFHEVKGVIQAESWYRVLYEQREVGFYRVQEQLVTEQVKGQETSAIKINCYGHINDQGGTRAFADILGWAKGVTGAEAENSWVGAKRFKGEFILDNQLKGEKFEYQIVDFENPGKGYREEGVWQKGALSIKQYSDMVKAEPTVAEPMDLNDSIYLSQVMGRLLGRVLEAKVGQEYVFLSYSNAALCYHSMRVADRVKLKIADIQKVQSTKEKNGQRQIGQIEALYLIGQVGTEGPIIETWLDERGQIVKQRADGVVLWRSSKEEIKKLWAGEVEKAN